MSREAKGWLFTTFGIAFLVTALLARSWRNWDEPPPVSIPGSEESVDFGPRQLPVNHQPTILQADAAVSPLSGDAAISPFYDNLTSPVAPSAWETAVAEEPSPPNAVRQGYDDLLPVPTTHQPQRP